MSRLLLNTCAKQRTRQGEVSGCCKLFYDTKADGRVERATRESRHLGEAFILSTTRSRAIEGWIPFDIDTPFFPKLNYQQLYRRDGGYTISEMWKSPTVGDRKLFPKVQLSQCANVEKKKNNIKNFQSCLLCISITYISPEWWEI